MAEKIKLADGIDLLNTHSKVAFETFLRMWPEWKNYAEVVAEANPAEGYYVLLSVPNEVSKENSLIVWAGNSEITVSFGYYHNHFYPEEIQAVCRFVDDILSDKIVFFEFRKEGKWIGSTYAPAGVPPDGSSLGQGADEVLSWSWTKPLGAISA